MRPPTLCSGDLVLFKILKENTLSGRQGSVPCHCIHPYSHQGSWCQSLDPSHQTQEAVLATQPLSKVDPDNRPTR